MIIGYKTWSYNRDQRVNDCWNTYIHNNSSHKIWSRANISNMENVLKVSRRCLLKMTLEKVPEKFLRKQENWGSKYLPCLQDHKLSPWAKQFLILMYKYVPGINMFCPLNVEKIREKIIFEIVYWPFKLPPNKPWPPGPVRLDSKIITEQNVFFQEHILP